MSLDKIPDIKRYKQIVCPLCNQTVNTPQRRKIGDMLVCNKCGIKYHKNIRDILKRIPFSSGITKQTNTKDKMSISNLIN